MVESPISRRRFSVREYIPQLFFDEAHAAWREAAAQAGTITDRCFRIAGLTFRLRFAGTQLLPHLVPAMEHLACPAVDTPDLTVHLWDEASYPTSLALPNDEMLQNYRDHQLHSCCNDQFRAFYEEWLGIFSYLNLETRQAFYCCLNAAQLPLYETTAPLRTILGNWLNLHDLQVVHASAVATPAGALLLAGPGGSGKSSTALLALEDGFSYLADDLCVITTKPVPMVHSLYNTAKLRTSHLDRLEKLASRMTHYEECGETKAIMFLQQDSPDRLDLQAPVRAILAPHVSGQPITRVTPANWSTALRALAPWSIRQVPGSGKKSVDLMFRFVSRVPAFDLHLGHDLPSVTAALRHILSEKNKPS